MHASHQGQGSTLHPVGGMWARYKHIIQRTHVPIFLVPSHVRLQRSLTHVAMVAGCWPERGTYAYVYDGPGGRPMGMHDKTAQAGRQPTQATRRATGRIQNLPRRACVQAKPPGPAFWTRPGCKYRVHSFIPLSIIATWLLAPQIQIIHGRPDEWKRRWIDGGAQPHC
jgi:hypothetical protein